MYKYIHIYIHIFQTSEERALYTCRYVYIYMYICIYVYIYIYIYIYIRRLRSVRFQCVQSSLRHKHPLQIVLHMNLLSRVTCRVSLVVRHLLLKNLLQNLCHLSILQNMPFLDPAERNICSMLMHTQQPPIPPRPALYAAPKFVAKLVECNLMILQTFLCFIC